MNILYILGAVFLGWFCTLSSGVLIGWMIFRTKKESHEAMFLQKKPETTAFNLDTDFEEEKEPPELPKIIDKMNEKLKNQMREGAG